MEREKCFVWYVSDTHYCVLYKPCLFHQWGRAMIDGYVVSVGIIENADRQIELVRPDLIIFSEPSTESLISYNIRKDCLDLRKLLNLNFITPDQYDELLLKYKNPNTFCDSATIYPATF